MADNTRVNELQDKLLKAMDILNAQALNSISFDKTITCKIETDKDKKDGKYEVNDGNRIFTAYSSDTRLRSGDTVYVTVPEGNFENQKMIIGKKTADNDKPFNFTQPFDTFFDMTGNILGENVGNELIANAINQYNNVPETEYEQKLLIEKTDLAISNYTRLALKANFKSWIKEAVRGDYGLLIVLYTKEENAINEQPKTSRYSFIFNNSDMYGNPYSFETNYSQEMVVPLEKVNGVVNKIQVYFYQNHNFYDKFNEPILCSEKGYLTEKDTNIYIKDDKGNYQLKENDTLLAPNLFVNNVYLSFGYDISIFTDDYVEIYTQNRNSYRRSTEVGNTYIEENQKEIKMRWVHLKDSNLVDMVAAAGNQFGEAEPNYEVRWYRYSVGAAAADQYCGIYWIEEKRGDFNLTFNPDINKQQEKIKAIVLCDGIPYRSNELIFENEENLPPSEEAQHIANALNIVCNDKTNGNYMIYGQDNSIKDTQYGKETRTLSAYFDTKNTGEYSDQVQQDNNLKWIFPTENSMIEVIDITIPSYKIKSYYSPSYSNNTVQCQYTLNDVVYTTEKEFTFGPAGTMGTDQTLVIDFVGDKNAIDINDINLKHQLQVQLYDNQNKLVTDFQDAAIEWSFYYQSDNKLTITSNNDDKTKADLTFGEGFDINSLYIAKVKIGKLETYLPLPIKDGYSYIKGPTQVIYQANGEPAYNREEYKLYNSMDENVKVDSWSVTTNDKYCGTINVYNKLCPLSIYVKNAPVYGVQAKIGNKIVWTQPILVLQNQWPNGVINAWDGESLKLDYETQTVLAAAISAGKKNSEDNTFSGVMMGDWGAQDVAGEIASQTGLYGFHHGAMSYAFKEDGTAFIGKSSMARINFDGSNATIYSSGYNQLGSAGMMIDLYGNNRKPAIYLKSANGNSTMQLSTEDKGSLIEMKRDSANQFIKITNAENSNPLTIGSKFHVNWDGNIYSIGGTIGGWNISTSQLSSNDGHITLNTNGYGSIILDNSESLISGGTIAGSTLSSTSGRASRIKLEGYFQLNNGGYIGEMESGLPGYSSTATGVGMAASGNTGAILATTANAGLRYTDNNYVTVTNTDTSIGNSTKIEINCKASGGESNKGIWIQGNSSGTTHLHIFNIPAQNQHGIYARFA